MQSLLLFALLAASLGACRASAWDYKLVVFAYRRRASLRRLFNSLNAARYGSKQVSLEFILEGESHPAVREYVQKASGRWPHGPSSVRFNKERKGLERNVIEAWSPETDRELVFFFEDDIEVAPGYFEYATGALEKYVAGPGEEIQQSAIAGVSLNSPPLNEIDIVHAPWTPKAAGVEGEAFLFGLPNSWGAVYVPWWWRRFLRYYEWRQAAGIPADYAVVPFSASNLWVRSWKRYLIEFFYLHGLVMVHPSLPRNAGLSTHHRENGQHTNLASAQTENLDALTRNTRFSVPLHREGVALPAAPLAVVSAHHRRVSSLWQLRQLGVWTEEALRPFGYLPAPRPCLLDYLSEPPHEKSSERLLTFTASGSQLERLYQMQNAMEYAKRLGRKLVLPSDPLFANLVDAPFQTRPVRYTPYSGRPLPFTSEAICIPTVNPDRIVEWFGQCQDECLRFENMLGVVEPTVPLKNDSQCPFKGCLHWAEPAEACKAGPRGDTKADELMHRASCLSAPPRPDAGTLILDESTLSLRDAMCCAKTPIFYGNIYSPWAHWIALQRRLAGLPTRFLGTLEEY